MKLSASTAVLAGLLACAPAASADPAAWDFKPGRTFSYEVTSEFHYVQLPPSVAGLDASDGTTRGVSRTAGAPTRSPFENRSTQPRSRRTCEPQWEKVTLDGVVLAVGDDGAARIEFRVGHVSIETRFDSSGEHAEWDSKDGKPTDLAGFRPYQAIVGHKFQVIVGRDGNVREIINGNWPAPDLKGTTREEKDARRNVAADITHAPTPVATWMSILFDTTPRSTPDWTVGLKLMEKENVALRADGTETVLGHDCLRAVLKSADRERVLKLDDTKVETVADLARLASEMVTAAQKRGNVWFGRRDGCLVKFELDAQAEVSEGGEVTHARMMWTASLKDLGFRDLAPAPQPGGNPEVQTGKK